jgi:two-component system cell cycle sensor histidine kinase/response regulator CckA
MPVMDGWQFRAAQKGDPTLARIPVLAVSADGSPQAEAIDAAAYLRKPLSSDALLRAIGKVLGEAERQRILGRLDEAERFAALGRLAASVGHEINNPLAYISMNLDLATDTIGRFLASAFTAGGQVPDDLAPVPVMLHDCRIGIDRIRDIVRDLQHLTQGAESKRATFEVSELLDESLAMARSKIDQRARVSKQYGVLPALTGDRSAIGQVLLNLLLNAAQALPDGHADSNEIAVRTFSEGRSVVIEVRDTGVGIPPHLLPRIFDPFFTTRKLGEGMGLGLAISCRIIADHGGRIEVESGPGKGSVFRVVLPVAGATLETSKGDQEDAVPKTAPQGPRVLVIDDDEAVGHLISLALAEYDVTVVFRARDAFALLAAHENFDVIICDLSIADLSGPEVLARLQSGWPEQAKNLTFMTGATLTPEIAAFVLRSKHRILTKPFSIDELRSMVDAQLEEQTRGRN